MIGSSMRKVAIVFLLAVIAPSLVLAWLAVRSLHDQELVAERQRALLYQGVADSLARQVQQQIAEQQREFAQRVETICGKLEPGVIAPQFDDYLRKTWPLAEVGFVVSLQGAMVCPPVPGRSEAQTFRLENEAFLSGYLSCNVTWSAPKVAAYGGSNDAAATAALLAGKTGVYATKKGGDETATPEEAKFIDIVGDAHEGTLARFLQNQLKLMLWYRSPRDPALVFGVQMKLPQLVAAVKPVFKVDASLNGTIGVVLLDDNGKPLTATLPDFAIAGRRPFVVSEIGETLPHWEVAVYLLDPTQLNRNAALIRTVLGLLIAVLVLAIGVGSWLIIADLRQHLALARQKTDFVSNVSHELKTPLTSIRMFAEMLAEDRVPEPDKRRQFHQIIAAEASRLTRLINNVLDFARLERGEKNYRLTEQDLVTLVAEIVATYRPHLETMGFTLDCELPGSALTVRGDRDALAQVLVNLLSNAEKYSAERKEIALRIESTANTVEVHIMDRGTGVPVGCEEKIFEQFYRGHDSLSSGIQGSGLGLTLARQITRAHDGEITFKRREGGGSCFSLRLPRIIHPS
jgi:signal transduction histidine kinase